MVADEGHVQVDMDESVDGLNYTEGLSMIGDNSTLTSSDEPVDEDEAFLVPHYREDEFLTLKGNSTGWFSPDGWSVFASANHTD